MMPDRVRGRSSSSPLFSSLFVIFLYGPMFVVYILSFQGEDGGLTFPLAGVSTHWFHELVDPNARSGDIAGAFQRSIGLGVVVSLLTVVLWSPPAWASAAASWDRR